MRFLSLAVALVISACSNSKDEAMDDLLDEMENTPNSPDVEEFDSGILETDASLTVDFTTAWSAEVPYAGAIGEAENFGAVLITSETEVEVTTDTVAISTWIDTDGDGVYHLSAENGVEAKNFVSDCTLVEVVERRVYAGPISPEVDGRLVFIDDFTVGGEYSTALNVVCTLTGSVPEGETYGIAVDVNHNEQAVIATDDGGESLVEVVGTPFFGH